MHEIESNFNPQTIACDGKTDNMFENMDELHRLAMLAESNVPFDVIFGGSCGKELGSSQSRNTASISFDAQNLKDKFIDLTGQNNLTDKMEDLPASKPSSGESNVDLFNNEYLDPAVKHPCPIEVVVNFNHENASANDESDSEGNNLDLITPGGYDPFKTFEPSGGKTDDRLKSIPNPPPNNESTENARFTHDGKLKAPAPLEGNCLPVTSEQIDLSVWLMSIPTQEGPN